MPRVIQKSKPAPPSPGARRFKTFAYVAKTYEDAKGDWWLEGIASGPALDAHGERMSPECVSDMADQMRSGQIRLLQGHYNDWEGVIGWIKEGEVNADGLLVIRCWLDKADGAVQKLWRQLTGDPARGIEPAKLGLSVGGWLIDAHSEIVDGDYVFTLDKLQLDHVAVTSRPANPEAWIDGVEVKQKAFGRPWLRDIAKAASETMRALRKGGDPVDEDEDKTGPNAPNGAESTGIEGEATPPAEEAKEATSADDQVGKTEPLNLEQIVKAAFDALIPAVEEVVKEQLKSSGMAIKYVRAIDLIGDELVAVKDETAEAEGEAEEGEEGDDSEGADDGEEGDDPDAADPEKSGKETDVKKTMLEQLALARLKARRLEQENAQLRAKAGVKPGEGIRRGVRDAEGDEAESVEKRGKGAVTKTDPAAWFTELKATPEYQKANNFDRQRLLRAALPAALGKALHAR
ncbi:MAG: hypothetical protein IT345_08095 [Trueperaceae bacterium]|nr:hypothetical protein [Trueperaceae bacterium]